MRASHYLETYDEELGTEPFRQGIHTLPPFVPQALDLTAALAEIEVEALRHLVAGKFLAALGDFAVPFHASRSGDAEADAWIAAAGPALASATSGGILHWRLAYPEDPWLRYWSGLVHRGQWRRVPALGEFARARALGLASLRVDRHLGES